VRSTRISGSVRPLSSGETNGVSVTDVPDLGRGRPVDSLDGYFERWSALHGGVDPRASWLIRGWLTMAYRCAKPLTAIGLSPNGVTVVGVLVAAVVPLLAWRGVATASSVWLWAALVVAVVTGLLDNLDGAVAVISGRTSRAGYVLDSVADRFSDALLLGSLWVLGAPGLLVALTIFVGFVQEYARARAGAAGISEVGVVSISERPTRIVIVSVFLGLCALAPYGVSVSTWATLGACMGLVVALIGALQVAVALAGRLRG